MSSTELRRPTPTVVLPLAALNPDLPPLITGRDERDPRFAAVDGRGTEGGGFQLVDDRSCASVDGRLVSLTPREFQVLALLVERRNRVVLRSELHTLMWHRRGRPRDRSVDVLIRRVRLKLADAAPGCEYIHTHYGLGYRFAPLPSQE